MKLDRVYAFNCVLSVFIVMQKSLSVSVSLTLAILRNFCATCSRDFSVVFAMYVEAGPFLLRKAALLLKGGECGTLLWIERDLAGADSSIMSSLARGTKIFRRTGASFSGYLESKETGKNGSRMFAPSMNPLCRPVRSRNSCALRVLRVLRPFGCIQDSSRKCVFRVMHPVF